MCMKHMYIKEVHSYTWLIYVDRCCVCFCWIGGSWLFVFMLRVPNGSWGLYKEVLHRS